MKSSLLFAFTLFAFFKATESGEHSGSGNQVIFTVIGKTTRESGYAHLVVPIPVPQLEKTINTLQDLVRTSTGTRYDELNLYKKAEHYGVNRIQEKINLILSLARKNGFVAKELELDDANLIQQSLDNLESRRRRSMASVTSALVGIASFGTSIFNNAQINRLNAARDELQNNQRFIMEELDVQGLRIANVTTFVAEQYKSWVDLVERLENGSKLTIMKEMDRQIHLLVQAFRMELTDFLSGITLLMENRLSPLLIKAGSLVSAFKNLADQAAVHNMKPMSEDAGILFQVSTSTFVNRQGKLFAIVHLPLYSGEMLTLYRYVPAPFFLGESKVVIEVHSPYEYLALDVHGMLGKQLTTADFQLCKKVGAVFHCPNMNLLNKNLEILCLYNLFSQVTSQIEKTCKVEVSRLRSHAVQISSSMYRIMTEKPILLVTECREGHNLTTIRGIYNLNLSDECPRASTPDHLFVRTPDLLLGSQELIALPLLARSEEWLGKIDEELDLTSVLDSMERLPQLDRTVPLTTFREHLHNQTFKTYKFVESVIVASVAYAAISVSLFIGMRWIITRGRGKRARRRPAQNRPSRTEVSDSDGGLMDRQLIPMLPPLVRRQWQ